MTLKANLSETGIQRLIDGVNQYRNDLNDKIDLFMSEIASEGVTTAKSECPISTGELYNSIVGTHDNNEKKAIIKVNCPYAIYVEMGTGIKGANKPHPDKSVIGFDFTYDRNGHGTAGWWYPTDASDPNPTKYTAEDGRMYAWTAGMPSRPFMYNTAKKIKELIRK